mmetsp:Transcript_28422/g.65944  ORF Transcript_28422/g.65944 Transcript_28422/m.65944 type:complete len:827 (+) Transcript_28422:110-2590(+)|eukprot:CAMPEP_0178432730 /NCGR_PEP_ID=MMETSP0689_2-20121128/32542_1 /TAXON_ID=160604 /ORGANISM="Amphidinium massartii, Strain CS-259" /LENGTH=826 /DNA_ID=CAMNT_0020054739 /DNA_START=17 /DNA_END=2497 /DNA_ORIENTATION=-
MTTPLASALISGSSSCGAGLLAPAPQAPPPSSHLFAERLRQIGAEFDREVRQSFEVAVQSVEGENRLLRGEVEWLQRQLEDERQQSAARLGLCAEFKRKMEELQEAHNHEVEVREFWRRECETHEEQRNLLEAKVAAIALAEKEETSSLSGSPGPTAGVARSTKSMLSPPRGASSSPAQRLATSPPGPDEDAAGAKCAEVPFDEPLDCHDIAKVERFVSLVEQSPSTEHLETCLVRMPVEDMHCILMRALERGQASAESSGSAIAAVQRIVRMWVRRLLNFNGGAAMQAAISSGSAEALGVLLSLGGLPSREAHADGQEDHLETATGADLPEQSSSSSSSRAPHPKAPRDTTSEVELLQLCVESGDAEKLAILLEHMQDSGRRSPGPLREAREFALSRGATGLATLLASHLVVELSILGNTHYRRADFQHAMTLYQEAIEYCEQGAVPALDGAEDPTIDPTRRQRENMVRLCYNMARAAHRLDRWSQARDLLTSALDMDPGYINAYILRAQAAMAAYDWEMAQADWDCLLRLQGGSQPAPGQDAEAVASWHKQREECARHLAAGHYEVLELPPLSGTEAVKRAYKDLARRWHPDKHEDKHKDLRERAAKKFGRIREAYAILSDERAKQAYDLTLPLMPSEGTSSRSVPVDNWLPHPSGNSSGSAGPKLASQSSSQSQKQKATMEEVLRGRRRATVDSAVINRGQEDFHNLGAHRKSSWDSGVSWESPWTSTTRDPRVVEEEQPGMKATRVPTGGRIRSSLLKVRLAARDQWAQRWQAGQKGGSPLDEHQQANPFEADLPDAEAFTHETAGAPSASRRNAQDWFAGF